MSTLREAALMALEAMEDSCYPRASTKHSTRYDDAIDVLRKALDADIMASLPKTVAWIWVFYDMANDRYVRRIIDCEERPNIPGYDLIPLYTAPPKRKWQGLTAEDHEAFCIRSNLHPVIAQTLAEYIEAKLKEKNT